MNLAGSALWSTLKGGTALTNLLTDGTAGIFEGHAGADASVPYVVLTEQAATWDYTMDTHRFVTALYMVKVVSGSAWPRQADLIDAQVDALLHGAALGVTGYGVLRCVRESDIRYEELDGDQVFYHVGALYRLDLHQSLP